MRTPKPKLLRPASWVPSAVLALILPACGGDSHGYRSPTAPPVPAPPPTSSASASFVGEMTVVSVSGQGLCTSSFRQGEVIGGAYWGLTYTADSFSLDFELGNHWYNGRLQGRSFAAEYIPSAAHTAPCDYRTSISGTFAEDFSSFEAQETFILGVAGPPEDQVRVELRWRASRNG